MFNFGITKIEVSQAMGGYHVYFDKGFTRFWFNLFNGDAYCHACSGLHPHKTF